MGGQGGEGKQLRGFAAAIALEHGAEPSACFRTAILRTQRCCGQREVFKVRVEPFRLVSQRGENLLPKGAWFCPSFAAVARGVGDGIPPDLRWVPAVLPAASSPTQCSSTQLLGCPLQPVSSPCPVRSKGTALQTQEHLQDLLPAPPAL